MRHEYIIVNKTALQKRLEELEFQREREPDNYTQSYLDGKIKQLNEVILKSTPLIPEIEKAFNVGVNSQFEVQEKNLTNKEDIRDYHQKKLINISDLKLDI